MRILALTKYGRLGASSRIRTLQYIPFLQKEGICVDVQSLLADEYLKYLYRKNIRRLDIILAGYLKRLFSLIKIKSYDLLWVEKELYPMFPVVLEKLLLDCKIPFVADYDDAVFHSYDMHHNRLIKFLFKNKIDEIMRLANVVIVGSKYLWQRAIKAGAKRVEQIPSVVNLEIYNYSDVFNKDVFRIGWIGSPSSVHYLDLISESLKRFCRNNRSVLVIIGDNNYHIDGVQVERLRWEEQKEEKHIHDIDVGIMPLFDGPWEKGKCAYKLIQYMACGRPVIASPVGENIEVVKNEENGFLPSTQDEWVSALKRLKDSIELRKTMGLAGRKMVEEKFCIQVSAPKLTNILKSVL